MKLADVKRMNLLLLEYLKLTEKRLLVIKENPPFVHSVKLTERQYKRVLKVNNKRQQLLLQLIKLDKISM